MDSFQDDKVQKLFWIGSVRGSRKGMQHVQGGQDAGMRSKVSGRDDGICIYIGDRVYDTYE